MKRFSPLVLSALIAALFAATPATAEELNCLMSRGNICFQTGCKNSAKTQRITLDMTAGTARFCPRRYDDSGCTSLSMTFKVTDTAITGVTLDTPEISAQSAFVNRTTGAIVFTLVTAGGIAAVDFGTCEIPR
jgi:hypothetical protein